MGHYASEMMGPYKGPNNREKAAEHKADLQKNWDWGKHLFNGGHVISHPVKSYTCPKCFSRVKHWFLEDHDDWHVRLKASGGLFSAI